MPLGVAQVAKCPNFAQNLIGKTWMIIHQKRNHTMQNSMDTNWAVTKPLTIWYTIYIYILMLGGFDRSTQLLHFMWGIGFGSWLELELLLGGKILRKSPENPGLLYLNLGEKSFPQKKTASGLFILRNPSPTRSENPVPKICGLMNDICVFVKGNFMCILYIY